MKLSEYSLCGWINCFLDMKKIYAQITVSGIEVESINSIFGNYKNLFIGEIVSYFKHPSDSLMYIVQVDIKNKYINVICRSSNIKKNTKVIVGIIGSTLSNGMVVKPFSINNIVSEGLILCFKDLNIFTNKNHIVYLPHSAPLGIKFKDYLFYQDKIIKINNIPNRMDLLGSFGVAREVCILNNLPLPQTLNISSALLVDNKCKIKIDDIIFRYSYRIIQGINLKIVTPMWMKEKLRRCSIKSVNIVVDIINYVFLELGHSLYVYSFLNNLHNIYVRYAKKNESIYLNNKRNIVLNSKNLVLATKVNIISLLGSINFNDFPINLNNTNLFIGSIFIDPKLLIRSIYQLKLNNNDLVYNEYYVDPVLQDQAVEYATNLFLNICGGCVSPIFNYSSLKCLFYINKRIKLYLNHINKLIGYKIDTIIIYNILKKLKYIIYIHDKFWYVIPPLWRLDICIAEDVISDIMKVYNFNSVIMAPLHVHNTTVQNYIEDYALKRVKYLLIDKGYHEVINYSFINSKTQKFIHPHKKSLALMNPMSTKMSCMRNSLWVGLIKNLLYHQNRQYDEVKFFESGVCFIPNKGSRMGVDQKIFLSGIIGINGDKKSLYTYDDKFDFYNLKGDIESIFNVTGCLERIKFKKSTISALHPKDSTTILLDDVVIGYLGSLNPVLIDQFNINYSVFLFEIFWFKISYSDVQFIKNVSEFPYSKRDISIILSENILVYDVIVLCKKYFFDKLVDVKIFDIYRGDSIPNQKKSISLKFIFQDLLYTLHDKEIDYMLNCYIIYLRNEFSILIRN